MIILENVCKRYRTDSGPGNWVLRGINLAIPSNLRVGLIGRNGAGKSTLLRLIAGTDSPTHGNVLRQCKVSWPMGYSGGLQGSLTGRQNAKFVCRIHGRASELETHLANIAQFAELGDYFDQPVKTYSSGMRSRLQLALSLNFDFDLYITDEVTSAGDAAFRAKSLSAFQQVVSRAGLIMVSHSEETLRQFCDAGIWLHRGQAYWFDKLDDALHHYKESHAHE